MLLCMFNVFSELVTSIKSIKATLTGVTIVDFIVDGTNKSSTVNPIFFCHSLTNSAQLQYLLIIFFLFYKSYAVIQ